MNAVDYKIIAVKEISNGVTNFFIYISVTQLRKPINVTGVNIQTSQHQLLISQIREIQSSERTKRSFSYDASIMSRTYKEKSVFGAGMLQCNFS